MIQKRTTEPSKNSVHAPWIHAAGILTALWLMIVFLITAVEAVAYWTPGYYKMEYEKYQVLDDLPEMTMDDLLSVTDEMMAYLRGNREDLHVFTTMGGEYREFFNAREIAHMEDVRGLFLGGLWLRRIGLMFTLAFAALLYFWKRGRKDRSAYLARAVPGSLCAGTGVFFAACLALAAVISTDFSRYFVVFHHIFFDNDLWILDPDTDRYAHQHRARGVLYGYGSADRHCFCHIRDHFLRSLPVPLAQGAESRGKRGKLILYLCFDFLYNDPKATKWGLFIYEI